MILLNKKIYLNKININGNINNKIKFTNDNNHKENIIVLLLFIYNSIITINHSSINTNSINDVENND